MDLDLISSISFVFSKTVVDLLGGFTDVKRLTSPADDTLDYTG